MTGEELGEFCAAQRKKTPWRRCLEDEQGHCPWLHVTMVCIFEGEELNRVTVCTLADPPVVQQPRHIGVLTGIDI